LNENTENADYNQYWYSSNTIDNIVKELIQLNGRVAFLSTPSVYFALPQELKNRSYCFDYDKKWSDDRGFVFYDFNDIQTIPTELYESFDVVVVDPPFIVKAVWEKYAEAARLLLKTGSETSYDGIIIPHGKVILTTIIENSDLLLNLLDARPTIFMPSVPHLVYQYNLFTNYPSEVFAQKNPEITD